MVVHWAFLPKDQSLHLGMEIDELCEECQPESLYPPISEEIHSQPPTLESEEAFHWGVQNCLYLSRSTVSYFKQIWTRGNWEPEKIRCYIVVEAI